MALRRKLGRGRRLYPCAMATSSIRSHWCKMSLRVMGTSTSRRSLFVFDGEAKMHMRSRRDDSSFGRRSKPVQALR